MRGRRVAAAGVDLLLGLLLGLVLSNTRVGFFFAERAAVMLRIGSPDTIWKGPVPMILGILGPLVYGLPFSILLVMLLEPLTGASPGKGLMGLRIISRGRSSTVRDQAVAPRRLWYRTAIKTAPLWGLLVALLAGSWMLALLFALVGCVLVLNFALAQFTSIELAHDAIARTGVVRRRRGTGSGIVSGGVVLEGD